MDRDDNPTSIGQFRIGQRVKETVEPFGTGIIQRFERGRRGWIVECRSEGGGHFGRWPEHLRPARPDDRWGEAPEDEAARLTDAE